MVSKCEKVKSGQEFKGCASDIISLQWSIPQLIFSFSPFPDFEPSSSWATRPPYLQEVGARLSDTLSFCPSHIPRTLILLIVVCLPSMSWGNIRIFMRTLAYTHLLEFSLQFFFASSSIYGLEMIKQNLLDDVPLTSATVLL